MKKIAMLFVAAAAIGFAVPASAQTVVIRDGMHRDGGYHHRDRGYRARAEWRHRDRGYHRGWNRGVRRGGPAIVIRP